MNTLYCEQSLKLIGFLPPESRIDLFKHNHYLYREQPTSVYTLLLSVDTFE